MNINEGLFCRCMKLFVLIHESLSFPVALRNRGALLLAWWGLMNSADLSVVPSPQTVGLLRCQTSLKA